MKLFDTQGAVNGFSSHFPRSRRACQRRYWSNCQRDFRNETDCRMPGAAPYPPLPMNRPLTPSLSPSDGERVVEGRARGGSWSQCVRKSEMGLPKNPGGDFPELCARVPPTNGGGGTPPGHHPPTTAKH